ncbi:MAG: sensor histidine kinase [Verrucomicrobiota bacterium]
MDIRLMSRTGLLWLGLWLGGLGLAATGGAEPLKNFAAVRALSADEATNGWPVQLDATVLGVDPASRGSLFMHDGTAGCYVKLLSGTNSPEFSPGTRLRLTGITMPLGYYPSIGRARAKVIGKAPIPEPVQLTAEQIFAPELDSAWVEVPAVVVGYEMGDQRFTLDLEIYGLPFKAELPMQDRIEERAMPLMQRRVRLRGILGTIFNRQRQMTDRHFFVPALEAIVPLKPNDRGEEELLIKVAQLLTAGFGSDAHIRVRGLITQADARGFYLRDESGSTLVYAARTGRYPPGTRVEVEGFGDVAPFRPILRATKVVDICREAPPAPVPFDFEKADLSLMQAELVTMEADYLGRREGRLETILQCRSGRQIFEALLPEGKSRFANLAVGDRLRLAGICELTTTHALPRISWVDGFRLHLPGAQGVKIIARAPWWTTQRLLVALGVMSIVAALGLAGTWALRRQVKRQLAVIGDTLQAEAVGKERDRMARELHDTLEQQLSGVALQLDGLSDAIQANPQAATKSLSLARRMLRFTRLEARRSVWDLRSKVLEKEGLAAALRVMAETATVPDGPVVEVTVSGEDRSLPTAVEFHLLRIAQEALANAIKHSEARQIMIRLQYAPDATRLSVEDNGRGFDPDAKEPSPGPHFGLLGMRERAAKIKSRLNVVSALQAGCTISVTLPAEPPPEKI